MPTVPGQVLGATSASDVGPQETKEWLEALQDVIGVEDPQRVAFLLDRQIEYARINDVTSSLHAETPYINTIPVESQDRIPGNQEIEHRIRSYARWSAMAMVPYAGKNTNVSGHVSSFVSVATLYDVGYNHFWRAPSDEHDDNMIFVQGHSMLGVYPRVFLLGRLTEEQLGNFRQEVDGKGISSYPHPWLMPDFWWLPTTLMDLDPIMAVYQARFTKHLASRGPIQNWEDRRVRVFLGGDETDEPESLGATGMADRGKLGNLVFAINCNLQRLDGPIRGNGEIIQELESEFRDADWNIIEVIWGGRWDQLLARDTEGLLISRMMECVDDECQTLRSENDAYIREHFFNTPELKAMVVGWSDDDIWALNRGGHDPHKIYAVLQSAANHEGQPTVILTKTIKGYGVSEAGGAMNIAHQQKKMLVDAIHKLRDHLNIPAADDQPEHAPYVKFEKDSKELEYMREARMDLGGYLPARRQKADAL